MDCKAAQSEMNAFAFDGRAVVRLLRYHLRLYRGRRHA
jgi:hypothetical protein